MNIKLLAELEKVISEWADDNCAEDYWPDVWVYDGYAKDMAKAAALVFDASANGQDFADSQRDRL